MEKINRIIRGNDFSLCIKASKVIDEQSVPVSFADFTDLQVHLIKAYSNERIDMPFVVNNDGDIIVSVSGLANTFYGIEIKGLYGGNKWRWARHGLFRIVEYEECSNTVDSETVNVDEYIVNVPVGQSALTRKDMEDYINEKMFIEDVIVDVDDAVGTPYGTGSFANGTLVLYLHCLKGEPGKDGVDGKDGKDGAEGKQGIPGESAIFDPTTGNISTMQQTTGTSIVSPMSQNAITEIVEENTRVLRKVPIGVNGKRLKDDQTATASSGSAVCYSSFLDITFLQSNQALEFPNLYKATNYSSIYFYTAADATTLISGADISVATDNSTYILDYNAIPEGAKYVRYNYYKNNGTNWGTSLSPFYVLTKTDKVNQLYTEVAPRTVTDCNYYEGRQINNVLNSSALLPKEMIPVTAGRVARLYGALQGGKYRFYDSNKAYISNSEANISYDINRFEKKVPTGAAYINADFDISKIDEIAVYDGSTLVWTPIKSKMLSDVNTELETYKSDTSNDLAEVAEHYKSYIRSKANTVYSKDFKYKGNGDSFIFLTDYHLPDAGTEGSTCSQFRHSAPLVRFIQKHTETKRFVFGGDIVCSPKTGQTTDNNRIVRHRWFTDDFKETNMLMCVGNHEWQNGIVAEDDKDIRNMYDFGNFCTNLNLLGAVFDTHKLPYYYFDNQSTKFRYFVLYAPCTNDDASDKIHLQEWQHAFLQAKVAELDNTWNIVVFQHVVGTSSSLYATYDENGEPTSMGHHAVGNRTREVLNAIQADPSKPRVRALVTGHTHFDFVEYESGYPVIVTTCDASYHRVLDGSTWEDAVYPNNNVRVPGTTDEQAFDVMHCSLDNNYWDLTRVGYGRDRIIRMTPISVSVGGTANVTPNIAVVSGDSFSYTMRDTAKATVSNGVITGVAAGKTVLQICNAAEYDNQTAWEYVEVIVS